MKDALGRGSDMIYTAAERREKARRSAARYRRNNPKKWKRIQRAANARYRVKYPERHTYAYKKKRGFSTGGKWKDRYGAKWRAKGGAIWSGMKSRCYNPKNKKFYLYGGMGVKVCRRWRESFANFLADMGPRPSKRHSIDRYPDPWGDYEPDNCRWATPKQQRASRRDCA